MKLFQVSALSFTECLLETQKTLVVTCDGSSSSQKATLIGVRRYSPLPSSEALLFEPGETYYWICEYIMDLCLVKVLKQNQRWLV